MRGNYHVQIHFSEPVADFIADDLELEGCTLACFRMLQSDLYAVEITPSGETVAIRVPAGVASPLTPTKSRSIDCRNTPAHLVLHAQPWSSKNSSLV